jgi:hypothetical protein
MTKSFVLKHGLTKIPVQFISKSKMSDFRIASPGEATLGAYSGLNVKIYISEDALKNNTNGLGTILHEIGEYITSEYSLEMSHEQLSVFTKVLHEILSQNKNQFKKLLR